MGVEGALFPDPGIVDDKDSKAKKNRGVDEVDQQRLARDQPESRRDVKETETRPWECRL